MGTNVYVDVGVFHTKFGLPAFKTGPNEWDQSLVDFRIKCMREELKEFIDGAAKRDHAEMFDALIDLVYFAAGTAHLMGYPWDEGWNAVQRANMAKVRGQKDGSDSKRGSGWDVVKPPGWTAPDIGAILESWGFVRSAPSQPRPSAHYCPVCGSNLYDDEHARTRYQIASTVYCSENCAREGG